MIYEAPNPYARKPRFLEHRRRAQGSCSGTLYIYMYTHTYYIYIYIYTYAYGICSATYMYEWYFVVAEFMR